MEPHLRSTTVAPDIGQRLERSIDALTDDEQKALILDLTGYARFLIQTEAHWLPRGVLPRGFDAPTLALEAIARVLDRRRRDWDPAKEPTLAAYLKSVVKSIFSSELLPAAKRELAEIPTTDDVGGDRTSGIASPDPGPHDMVTLNELKDRLLECFEREEDQLVLLCIFENVTAPAEIAQVTGLDPREIYRIKQKIWRRVVGLRKGE